MNTRPGGIAALTFFFVFGATMSALSAFLLTFPGTALDRAWGINPEGQHGLQALGWPAVALMACVCLVCAVAAIGLWNGRGWGRVLAIAILLVNAAGDTLNGLLRHDLRTLIGLPIVAAVVYYLGTRRVRAYFEPSPRRE